LLRTRVISAVILAPFFLGLIYLGFPYLHFLVAAMAGVMAWEFGQMDRGSGPKRRMFLVIATTAAVAVTTLAGLIAGLAVTYVATIAAVVSEGLCGRRDRNPIFLAVPYVALPAVAVLFVHKVGGVNSVFWVLAVVWGTDIGAYAFGRLIGGPKLAPRISPNKTWAGAIGGLVCGVGAGAALSAALNMPLSEPMFAAAATVALAAEAGDLFESALKRWYDVKDSGTLIPGHGGVMDRFDGLWAAAPVAAMFCVIFDGGVQRW
jgi:phosphatidate cytidylyltransferase